MMPGVDGYNTQRREVGARVTCTPLVLAVLAVARFLDGSRAFERRRTPIGASLTRCGRRLPRFDECDVDFSARIREAQYSGV